MPDEPKLRTGLDDLAWLSEYVSVALRTNYCLLSKERSSTFKLFSLVSNNNILMVVTYWCKISVAQHCTQILESTFSEKSPRSQRPAIKVSNHYT